MTPEEHGREAMSLETARAEMNRVRLQVYLMQQNAGASVREVLADVVPILRQIRSRYGAEEARPYQEWFSACREASSEALDASHRAFRTWSAQTVQARVTPTCQHFDRRG
jgi:hypothetical protein